MRSRSEKYLIIGNDAVSAATLCKLYGVQREECFLTTEEDHQRWPGMYSHWGLVELRQAQDGVYVLPPTFVTVGAA